MVPLSTPQVSGVSTSRFAPFEPPAKPKWGYERQDNLTPDEVEVLQAWTWRQALRIGLHIAAMKIIDLMTIVGRRIQPTGKIIANLVGCSEGTGRKYLRKLDALGFFTRITEHITYFEDEPSNTRDPETGEWVEGEPGFRTISAVREVVIPEFPQVSEESDRLARTRVHVQEIAVRNRSDQQEHDLEEVCEPELAHDSVPREEEEAVVSFSSEMKRQGMDSYTAWAKTIDFAEFLVDRRPLSPEREAAVVALANKAFTGNDQVSDAIFTKGLLLAIEADESSSDPQAYLDSLREELREASLANDEVQNRRLAKAEAKRLRKQRRRLRDTP